MKTRLTLTILFAATLGGCPPPPCEDAELRWLDGGPRDAGMQDAEPAPSGVFELRFSCVDGEQVIVCANGSGGSECRCEVDERAQQDDGGAARTFRDARGTSALHQALGAQEERRRFADEGCGWNVEGSL